MQSYKKLVLIIAICCLMILQPLTAIAIYNAGQNHVEESLRDDTVKQARIESNTYNNMIQLNVAFPKPTIKEISNYHSVEMLGLQRYAAKGEPMLPFIALKVVVPTSRKVSNIDVSYGNVKILEGKYQVEFGRTPVPISQKPMSIDEPNRMIYDSAQPFPRSLHSEPSYQYFRGYEILHLTLYPVQYFPKTGGLIYYESMEVTVDLTVSDKAHPFFRDLPEDKTVVQSLVDNPETLELYTTPQTTLKTTSIVNPSESYDYVIITKAALNTSFQPLIDWKITKGLNATTVLVEDILNDPDYFCDGVFGDGCGSKFNDTAAKVRNFIKDAYLNWGTEYVLLGGDVGITGYRGVYGFVATDPITQDQNMPCDLYFGALDGSWDNDNDTIFGEGVYGVGSGSPQNGTAGDEADLYSEVYIGRAPVGSVNTTINFVNKTLWYEQATDDSYYKKALFVAENLDEETEGANSKDLTAGEIPEYTLTRLYERDYTYSRAATINAINNGVHILNHDGHCNANHMMDMNREEIDNEITNTAEFFFGYSTGCYAAAFEGDCVVEHFVRNPTGSFAFISNSRYGWYMPGTTAGVGDMFDREFFKVLNDTDAHLGKTLQLSKETYASGDMGNSVRWTYFELNLLGDPEVELVTEIQAPTAYFETNPSADRLSPAVVKGVVNLTGIARRGTAIGSTFSNYSIEYYHGGWISTGITLVNNGQSEVTDDLLATWDTNIITPAIKTLRLVVTDENGTTGEDRWIVKVEELPAIRVDPQLTETSEGLNFTVSVKITDPEDLFGLDIELKWNTTLANYVSHEVYIPQDNFWWGVLYSPTSITTNTVNEIAGTYHITAKSTGWDPFERDGVVFNMTFNAKKNGTLLLEVSSSNLTNRDDQTLDHKTANGTVSIGPGVHDVEAISIIPRKTIVGDGYQVKLNVTVSNEGTFLETLNITVYANATIIDTFQENVSILSQETLTVIWNTTGFGKGNYILSVEVDALVGETDLLDNNCTATEIVTITIPGDVDANFKVDIFDIVRIAGSYMKSKGDPGFDPNCDIDDTGIINIFDIVIAANHYLESWP